MPNPYAGGKDYCKKKFPFPETPGKGKAPVKDKTRLQAEEIGRNYNKGSGMKPKKGKMPKGDMD